MSDGKNRGEHSMDERLKETLSAMMDDEADELSVRRVLSDQQQESVSEQWQRWQHLRDLIHDTSVPALSVDVSEQVRRQLDGNAAVAGSASAAASAGQASSGQRSFWRWSAVALVAVSVTLGFGAGSQWADQDIEGPAAVATVSAAEEVPEIALQGLDEEQWEHLSRYLLEHAQHNSVGAGRGSVGYARLASASGPVR